MSQNVLSLFGWFVLLLALQVLIFNHIHLFGYATPMVCVMFLLILPSRASRWVSVTLGFLMGLTVDVFNNTPGMGAAALTAVGLVAPQFRRLYEPNDRADEDYQPSSLTMEWPAYIRYALSACLLHSALYFLIEAFSFSLWSTVLFSILGSTVVSLFVILAIELIRSGGKRK